MFSSVKSLILHLPVESRVLYLKVALIVFFLPNIIELQKFIVTLRMATLSKILIMCVGLAIFGNLWAQSCSFVLCPFLWGCVNNLNRKEASNE